jgi:tetratricopeptide (TPR) repeat protein
MERYFAEMRSVLERHGGTVEKFIGDAVMAAFGIPAAHEDDALRAVRAAAEMGDRLADLNGEFERERGISLEVRTGVDTGEVVTGDPSGGQFYATGDAVNVAARLEQAAEPGEVLLGEQTYRLVQDTVRVEPVGPLTLKGKAGPVAPYRLLEVVEGAPAVASRFDTPFVGRKEELARLLGCFNRSVEEKTPLLVTVLGAAGLGKTRLTAELFAKIGERATILEGRCLSYGEGITFWPLQEILRGLRERPAGAPEPERARGTEETFWAYRKLFEALAKERPLVLVLEDIHWAESTLLDLIEHIVEWTREAPMLIVCLARPHLLDERPGWPGELIELEPLPSKEAETLVAMLAAGVDPATRVRATEVAEGNPLFLEQLLALAEEDGDVLAVPDTIQALLSARLDRLAPEERALLEAGAVVGKEFWRSALLHLSAPGAEVSALLQRLVRRGLIQPERSSLPDEDAFRFGHILIRDATYNGIPKEIRAELHERLADWLDESEIPYEEIVGYHLEQAYRYRAELSPIDQALRALGDRASDLLAQAGQHALLRADHAAAVNLLDRARSLQSDHARRLTLSVSLAEALWLTGDLEQARTLLNDVIAEASERGDQRNEWLARLSYADVSSSVVPHEWMDDRMKETAERALRAFDALSDDRGLARAWALAAQVSWNQTHYREAARQSARALAHVRRTGDEHEELMALNFLLQAMYRGSTHVSEVRPQIERFLARVGESSALGFRALLTLAGLCAMEAAADESRRLFERAKSIGEELRLDWAPDRTAAVAEEVGLLLDAEFAERELRAGYEFLEAIGERSRRSTVAAQLADALYRLDRKADAEHFANLSLELTSRDDVASQARGRAVKAKLLAAQGDYEAAYDLAREAVGLSDDTDDLFQRGQILMALAEVLRLGGRDADAIPVLRQVVEVSERKGNVVTAQEARASLAGLNADTGAPRAGSG